MSMGWQGDNSCQVSTHLGPQFSARSHSLGHCGNCACALLVQGFAHVWCRGFALWCFHSTTVSVSAQHNIYTLYNAFNYSFCFCISEAYPIQSVSRSKVVYNYTVRFCISDVYHHTVSRSQISSNLSLNSSAVGLLEAEPSQLLFRRSNRG